MLFYSAIYNLITDPKARYNWSFNFPPAGWWRDSRGEEFSARCLPYEIPGCDSKGCAVVEYPKKRQDQLNCDHFMGIGKLPFQIVDFKQHLLSKQPLPVSRTTLPLVWAIDNAWLEPGDDLDWNDSTAKLCIEWFQVGIDGVCKVQFDFSSLHYRSTKVNLAVPPIILRLQSPVVFIGLFKSTALRCCFPVI